MIQTKLSETSREKEGIEQFYAMVKPYTDITELTREILLDFIDKIIVYEATGKGRNHRRQTIEIQYRFVGQLPIGKVSL